MIDVSDGLLLDLRRILAASGVGAEVEAEALPVSARMEALCRRHGWNLRELQLTGGEDYVLLFTVSAKNELRLRKEPIDYFRIGRVDPQPAAGRPPSWPDPFPAALGV